jgi:hypothetical protein
MIKQINTPTAAQQAASWQQQCADRGWYSGEELQPYQGRPGACKPTPCPASTTASAYPAPRRSASPPLKKSSPKIMINTNNSRNLSAPTIIGLAGFAGTGKDTVADLLRTHVRFGKCAFADQLRYEVCEAFSIEPALLTDRKTKEVPHPSLALAECKNNEFVGVLLRGAVYDQFEGSVEDFLTAARSPRQIMQLWGTEFRRASDTNYWTRQLTRQIIDSAHYGNTRHVITDVRFENEAQAVRNMGGVVWQVNRPGLATDTSHSSESDGSQFKPDAVIDNSKDIRHLQSVVMGAWLMLETGMSAQEVFNMGMVHSDLACDQSGVGVMALHI